LGFVPETQEFQVKGLTNALDGWWLAIENNKSQQWLNESNIEANM
jgi:hypothetical protein